MIKDNPELRHFLRHVLYAIEESLLGHKEAALYEIRQIQGMVSWGDDDEQFRRFCKMKWKGRKEVMKLAGKKKKGKKCR